MMKNYITGALIIGLCIVVGFAFFGGKTTIEYGASSGPDHYNLESFYAGLIDGGEITTLTAATTTSITALQICESGVINFPAIGAGATTTLPGAAAMNTQCLMVNGASKTFLFRNTSDAASTTVFVVASTTSDTLLMPEGADVIIEGANSAFVTFLRTAASTIVINITELVDAD